jgi:hypothetical protein
MDSTSNLPQMTGGQPEKEVLFNELMGAASTATLFGIDPDATLALTFGYFGGKYRKADGTMLDLSNGTVALTASATNYILETDGVVSKVTAAPSGWPSPLAGGAKALYQVVCDASGVNPAAWPTGGYKDYRTTGIGSGNTSTPAAADVSIVDAGAYYTGTDVEAALQELGATVSTLSATTDVDTDEVFTSDTSSTADSDPGNGKFKWNNATQGSATALYVDNQTADAVSLVTFFASLPPDGYIHLAQNDDATKWQVWKWSGLPTAATGYYKFTGLTLMASGGSIANTKAVSVSFKGTTPSTWPFVIGLFYPGVPTASALVGSFAAPAGITTLTFAAALSGSSGKALVAATAQTDFDVRKNAATSSGGTSVGTIRFAASGTVPTFIAASGFTLTGGTDYLTVWAPASPDATLANIAASLYCTR